MLAFITFSFCPRYSLRITFYQFDKRLLVFDLMSVYRIYLFLCALKSTQGFLYETDIIDTMLQIHN